MQGGGRIASLAGSIADTRFPRTATRSQALLQLPSGKEYVMSNGTTVGLGLLAGLVGLTAALAQTGPGQSSLHAAATPKMHLATIGSQVDAARGRIWWLTGGGLLLYDRARQQRITLPLPGWHWAGAPYGCLPSLALGPKGEVIVTSDVLPKLWRVDPESLVVTVHSPALDAQGDRDVGFAALSYSARHGAYFAVDSTPGSLWRIDPLLRRAQEAPLAAEAAPACRATGPIPTSLFLEL
jgi:hypothetical protein